TTTTSSSSATAESAPAAAPPPSWQADPLQDLLLFVTQNRLDGFESLFCLLVGHLFSPASRDQRVT
ncbi:MAG TPA: hypothetical protein DCE47_16350, partial [Planctomycetaceae bacterium]|nr:hypothetical protein [Planctomycetaceae bacterium]